MIKHAPYMIKHAPYMIKHAPYMIKHDLNWLSIYFYVLTQFVVKKKTAAHLKL